MGDHSEVNEVDYITHVVDRREKEDDDQGTYETTVIDARDDEGTYETTVIDARDDERTYETTVIDARDDEGTYETTVIDARDDKGTYETTVIDARDDEGTYETTVIDARDDKGTYETTVIDARDGNDKLTSQMAKCEVKDSSDGQNNDYDVSAGGPGTTYVPVVVNPRIEMEKRQMEGHVEKLVQKKWKQRYLLLCPFTRTLAYYLNQPRNKNEVRGIYPLLGAVVSRRSPREGKHYFTLTLHTGKNVEFRLDSDDEMRMWSDHMEVAANKPQAALQSKREGEAQEPGTVGAKKRWLVLDPARHTLALHEVRGGAKDKLVEEYPLQGAAVSPDKSYGSAFDLTLRLRTGKKLKLRWTSKYQWGEWCDNLHYVIQSDMRY